MISIATFQLKEPIAHGISTIKCEQNNSTFKS